MFWKSAWRRGTQSLETLWITWFEALFCTPWHFFPKWLSIVIFERGIQSFGPGIYVEKSIYTCIRDVFFQKYIIYVYDILCVMFSHVNLEACNENSLAPRLEANLLWSLLLQGLDTSYVKCLWRRRRGRWWDLNWFTGLLDIETLLFANCYIKTLSLQFFRCIRY